MSEAITIFDRGWIFRIHPAIRVPPKHAILMVHGWTGDERSMEVFAQNLPDDCFVMLPRGPLPAQPNGYGWTDADRRDAGMAAFVPAAQALLAEIDSLAASYSIQGMKLRIAGFSQGSAVCHTLAFLAPQRIERAAILAGFLPQPEPDLTWPDLTGKAYFLAHGTLDETVPVSHAHASIPLLEAARANVQYCEQPVGHKLAASCLRELRAFLTG